jgi:class 3 adenylate cyclase
MTNPQDTEKPLANLEFREGAVALIDALGFKGIWQRYSEKDVVAKLQQLADTTCDETSRLQEAARRSNGNLLEFVRTSFLSDSVVFGVATKPLEDVATGLRSVGLGDIAAFNTESLAGEAVSIVAELLSTLIRRALEPPIPLAFRGAISFGRFGMSERFIIGPAIDEAAEWMNRAHGAFIVLAPSAGKFPQGGPPSISSVFRYTVPLKKRKAHEVESDDMLVVSPFARVDDPAKRKELLDGLTKSFEVCSTACGEKRLDVEEKLSATLRFLAAAEKAEKSAFTGAWARAIRP